MLKLLITLAVLGSAADASAAYFERVRPVNGSVLGAILAKKIPVADSNDTSESHIYGSSSGKGTFYIGGCPINIVSRPETESLVSGVYKFRIPSGAKSAEWDDLTLSPDVVVYVEVDRENKVERLTLSYGKTGEDKELELTQTAGGKITLNLYTNSYGYDGKRQQLRVSCNEGL
jgi:hypothetical protein